MSDAEGAANNAPDAGPSETPPPPPVAQEPGRRRLGKRNAALAVLVPALALLAVATRPWATGRARDVLTAGVTEVTGTTAAPGVLAVTAVAVVALLGLLTGGRLIRAASAGVVVLASLGSLALTVVVALRPVTAVADAVARELARTTAPATVGRSTVWVWLALVVAFLLTVGAVAAAVSSRSWAGLSSRYDRDTRAAAGPRGQTRTAWDELSEGGDPTLRDPTLHDGSEPT